MQTSVQKTTLLLGLTGTVIGLGLIVWIYSTPKADSVPLWVLKLPAINAGLNAISAFALIKGWIHIRSGRRMQHIRWMVTALVTSGLFLIGYLCYHHFHGDTKFLATGWIRPIYFFILISHIILSFINLPMILITLGFAVSSNFTSHKKIARWTLPVWLYVSVTGVLIFLLLKIFQPA